MNRQFKKTRLAPTPSGYLHLGNVLSFSITAAIAQKCNAKILLRIDDLDRLRADTIYVQDVFDTLNFLEIPWDEGPANTDDFNKNYSQIHRRGIYNGALAQLAEKNLVFACTCSRKDLLTQGACSCMNKHIPLNTENASWRLVTDDEHELIVKNYDGRQIHGFLPEEMRDFMVRKKDGYPAYQLTSVVDDLFYGVDLVVRGDDLWPSTQAQHALAAALRNSRFNDISFLHHPLLADPAGRKMSKSAGDTSVRYLRERGESKAGVFGRIGGMLGFNERIESWSELAELLV